MNGTTAIVLMNARLLIGKSTTATPQTIFKFCSITILSSTTGKTMIQSLLITTGKKYFDKVRHVALFKVIFLLVTFLSKISVHVKLWTATRLQLSPLTVVLHKDLILPPLYSSPILIVYFLMTAGPIYIRDYGD